MNSLEGRLTTYVNYSHALNICDEELMNYIIEGLMIIGIFCRNIALHCIRVSSYSMAIGKRLELSSKEINLLWCPSIFHDIGKTQIPVEIVKKQAKLTKIEEWKVDAIRW